MVGGSRFCCAMSLTQKQIFFIRHGQASHNIDPDFIEVPDNALTAHGRRQAAKAGELLRQIQKDESP